jgi:hypothetical protein
MSKETVNDYVKRARKGGRSEISTDPSKRGAKARFVIDATSGEVLSEGYLSVSP